MTKQIKINWNCPKSIKQGEKLKAQYENKNYRLVNTISGLDYAILTYSTI